nr:MAG TPA: hypothetical protein [Caudoviricetes sp.]
MVRDAEWKVKKGSRFTATANVLKLSFAKKRKK